MGMIITSQCESCQYGAIDKTDRARIKVYCSMKGKTYCYGQRIQCDSYKKKTGIGDISEAFTERDMEFNHRMVKKGQEAKLVYEAQNLKRGR